MSSWKFIGQRHNSIPPEALLKCGCFNTPTTRQRPGTAKGLIFLTLEDETGHANIIVMPDVYGADPMVVMHERFVRVHGQVQNQDGVVHLKAQKIMPLSVSAADVASHDFH